MKNECRPWGWNVYEAADARWYYEPAGWRDCDSPDYGNGTGPYSVGYLTEDDALVGCWDEVDDIRARAVLLARA